MAASVTDADSAKRTDFLTDQCPLSPDLQPCRRRVSFEAERGLEILGHAIDYLMDEYLQSQGLIRAEDPEVQAVQILMALNREIYLSCPVVPTLRQRWNAFWRRSNRRADG